MSSQREQIRALHKARPRDRFLRGSLIAVACLVLYSLTMGDFSFADLFSDQRQSRLAKFWEYLTDKDEPGSPRDLIRTDIRSRAFEATMTTLWLSIAAIFLAGLGSIALSPFAARNLAAADPFISSPKPPSAARRFLWGAVVWVTRGILVIARAIPEYIWAFLLIGLFGLGAWPAVLALALHNLGILGRLGAETLENQAAQTPAALRGLGASRAKIYFTDLVPNALPRWIVYFFYRWETCVRESVILGMLGVTSLGYYIFNEARPRDLYDVMFYFTMLGVVLVFCADILSALIRWRLRKVS
ncbi:MAG: PhnE/PtxC family ABC transporter permease [Verrucomicrobiales bacterium]